MSDPTLFSDAPTCDHGRVVGACTVCDTIARDRRGKARRDHPQTSQTAADKAKGKSGTKRRMVYDYLVETNERYVWPSGGATDDEMQEALNMPPNTQRPRRVELVDRGLVEDSGRTRYNRYGSECIVWQAVR